MADVPAAATTSAAASSDALFPTIPYGVRWPSRDFSGNPGTFEELFRKFKGLSGLKINRSELSSVFNLDLSPMCFEGAKFSASKALSSHFQVNHTLMMGGPNTFKWGASYIGTNQYSAHEIFPIIIGDMDANGSVNANIVHQLSDSVRCKVIVQIAKNAVNALQISSDYRMQNQTISGHLVNADLIRRQGIFIAQYLHRISPHLDAGIEYCHNYARAPPKSKQPSIHAGTFQVAARYRQQESFWVGAVNPLMGIVHIGYWRRRRLSPIQFGLELELSPNDTVTTLAYQVDVDKTGDCTFRAFTDSNWNVGAVLEKRIGQLPFTLLLSGLINQGTGSYKFGFGMNMNFDLKSITDGANKMFNRIQQVTQETLGQAEKTQLDSGLDDCLKRIDKQEIWIDRLIDQADVIVQPSQVDKIEGFILSKMGQSTKDKPNTIEVLGRLMLDASVDIGPTSQFGSALRKIGEVELQMGKAKKEADERIASGFCQPLRGFVEGDLKDLQKERKVLENARFTLDSTKNKMKRTNAQTQSDTETLSTSQAAFERQMEVTRLLIDQIEHSTNNTQLRCLVDLVEAQHDYYAKCASLLNELKNKF